MSTKAELGRLPGDPGTQGVVEPVDAVQQRQGDQLVTATVVSRVSPVVTGPSSCSFTNRSSGKNSSRCPGGTSTAIIPSCPWS
jgi:hypothetical protein